MAKHPTRRATAPRCESAVPRDDRQDLENSAGPGHSTEEVRVRDILDDGSVRSASAAGECPLALDVRARWRRAYGSGLRSGIARPLLADAARDTRDRIRDVC